MITLDQWRAALAAVLDDYRDVTVPPASADQAPTTKRVHVTDPDAQTWRKHTCGPVPRLLDAAPDEAATQDETHSVPARDGEAALPHQARHAVISARARQARGLVAGTPAEAHGVLVLPVTLVLSPLPAEVIWTPIPSAAEVAAFGGVKKT